MTLEQIIKQIKPINNCMLLLCFLRIDGLWVRWICLHIGRNNAGTVKLLYRPGCHGRFVGRY